MVALGDRVRCENKYQQPDCEIRRQGRNGSQGEAVSQAGSRFGHQRHGQQGSGERNEFVGFDNQCQRSDDG